MRVFRFVLAVLAFVPPALQAELLPLNPGATWEYRAEGVAEPLTIRVGLNQLYIADGRTYGRLFGYVDQPLWVRIDPAGDLVYLDEETGTDRLLTRFAVDDRAWFEAPFRGCDQEGQAHSNLVPYAGPTGSFGATTAVRYRNFSCADVGVESEMFAENVGMVGRSVSTIAGPVVYKLVYADTGAVQVGPRRNVTLDLSLDLIDERSVRAVLRLTGDPDAAPTLAFATSQEFEVVLRDPQGRVAWRWSDGRLFTPTLQEKHAVNLRYEAVIPLDPGGARLPGGDYAVEATITTADDRRPQIRAALHLDPVERQPKAIRPQRSRSGRDYFQTK